MMNKFMKISFIAFSNIRSSWIKNLVLCVQIAIAICLMNISLSRFLHESYMSNFIQTTGLYDQFIYVTGKSKPQVKKEKVVSEIKQELTKLANSGEIDSFYTTAYFPIIWDNGDRIDLYIYPNELASNVSYPLSKGEWLSEANVESGFVPIVISNDLSRVFKIGDTIDIKKLSGTKGKIVGILRKDTMIYLSGVSGSGIQLDSIFQYAKSAMIIGGNLDLPEEQLFIEAFVNTNSSTDLDYAKVKCIDKLGNVADIFTFKDLAEENRRINYTLIEMQTLVFIMVFLLSYFGISGNNYLSTIKSKKKFSLYFMCGMEWGQCLKITIYEKMLVLIFPSIIGYAFFLNFCSATDYYAIRIEPINPILTLLTILIVFVTTTLKPIISLAKSSPIEEIKKI